MSFILLKEFVIDLKGEASISKFSFGVIILMTSNGGWIDYIFLEVFPCVLNLTLTSKNILTEKGVLYFFLLNRIIQVM